MAKLKSFDDVHKVLAEFVPSVTTQRQPYTLERIRSLLQFLGNPQDSYKTVHVAGTSGKTSTCYYVAAMLEAHGKKVGLTVSPHVDEVNERVQINLKPLSEKRFSAQLAKFLKLVEKSGLKPTYFEVLMAFAYWQFANEKIDYAVVEVGLGGLLDGSNVITRPDKVCVITDIGLDHTEHLGRTLEAIAAQKAGIIKAYNIVFSYQQTDDVMQVLREVAIQQQAELHEVLPIKNSELPVNLPLFQRRNWYLALSVCRFVEVRDKLRTLSPSQIEKTTYTYIPARMEVASYKDRQIIMDGAHNNQKLRTLLKSAKNQYPKQEIAILASFVKSGKSRTKGALKAIQPIASHMIITSFAGEQDAPQVSVDPLKIAEWCEEVGFSNWEIENSPAKALQKLLRRKEPVLLVTGSFYLLNHIRPLIKNKGS